MQLHRGYSEILLQQERGGAAREAAEDLPAREIRRDVRLLVPDAVLRGLHLRGAGRSPGLVPAGAQGAAGMPQVEGGVEAADEADGVERRGAVDAVGQPGDHKLGVGAPRGWGGGGGGGGSTAAVLVLVLDAGAVEGPAILPRHRYEGRQV